jgi:hypothetical protein
MSFSDINLNVDSWKNRQRTSRRASFISFVANFWKGSGAMELNPLKIPIGSLAAFAAVIIFCAFLTLSAARFPQGFSPLDVRIGDLGNAGLNPDGAAAFNAGCMIAGIPLIVFFGGLYKWYTGELWRNLFVAGAQLAGVAAGISLIMTGYYPELFAGEHLLWSTVLFVSLLLALLLANSGLLTHWKYSNRAGYVGMASVAMLVVFLAAKFAAAEIPAFEWASLTLALAWTIAMGLDMYFTFT